MLIYFSSYIRSRKNSMYVDYIYNIYILSYWTYVSCDTHIRRDIRILKRYVISCSASFWTMFSGNKLRNSNVEHVTVTAFNSEITAVYMFLCIRLKFQRSEPTSEFYTKHNTDKLICLRMVTLLRVSGYRPRCPGFDSRPYQIFWEVGGLERGPLSLVRGYLNEKIEAPV
jgi:hypothetical protein